MTLHHKTPKHFEHYVNSVNNFDIDECVNYLIANSRFAMSKKYSLNQGKNQSQRKDFDMKCKSIGRVAVMPRDYHLSLSVVDIVKNIKALEQYKPVKEVSYKAASNLNIELDIPLVSADNNKAIIVKVCDDAGKGFERKIINNKFYCEAEIVRRSMHPEANIFIMAIERDAPHATAIYKISDELLELAEQENSSKIEMINDCVINNHYPTYFDGNAKIINKPNYL